jgi:hypothetical protein
MFVTVAGTITAMAGWKLNQSLATALLPGRPRTVDVVDLVYRSRTRDRGPKIVALEAGPGSPICSEG